MKPMNMIFAVLMFVTVIVTGTGWYGGLVTDYTHLNATEKINTTDLHHGDMLTDINQTQADMESGMDTVIGQIPLLGGQLVQVFNGLQMLQSFLVALWGSFNLGVTLITDFDEIIPFPIHPSIIAIIQVSLGLFVISAIVWFIWGRRPD